MNRSCQCQFSTHCRIYEVYSSSEQPEDDQFIRNCCNGPERDYCPIHRYHQALRPPVDSGRPIAAGRIGIVNEQSSSPK